jgi:predicted DNA-binding transcriptional regulator AlpA
MYDQHPLPDQLIRLQQVETLSGLKRSQIYALTARGEFPTPTKLGAASRWWQIEGRESAGVDFTETCNADDLFD